MVKTTFSLPPAVLQNQGDRCVIANKHRRLMIRVSWRQRPLVSLPPPSTTPTNNTNNANINNLQQASTTQQQSSLVSSSTAPARSSSTSRTKPSGTASSLAPLGGLVAGTTPTAATTPRQQTPSQPKNNSFGGGVRPVVRVSTSGRRGPSSVPSSSSSPQGPPPPLSAADSSINKTHSASQNRGVSSSVKKGRGQSPPASGAKRPQRAGGGSSPPTTVNKGSNSRGGSPPTSRAGKSSNTKTGRGGTAGQRAKSGSGEGGNAADDLAGSLSASAVPPPPPLYHPAYECHEPPTDYQRYYLSKRSHETIIEGSNHIVLVAPPVDLYHEARRGPHHHQAAPSSSSTAPSTTMIAAAAEGASSVSIPTSLSHQQVITQNENEEQDDISPAQKVDCSNPTLRALLHSVSHTTPKSLLRQSNGSSSINSGAHPHQRQQLSSRGLVQSPNGVVTASATSPRHISVVSNTQSLATASSLFLIDSCLHALDGVTGVHVDHVDLGRPHGIQDALVHRPAMLTDAYAKAVKAPVDAGTFTESVLKQKRTSTTVGILVPPQASPDQQQASPSLNQKSPRRLPSIPFGSNAPPLTTSSSFERGTSAHSTAPPRKARSPPSQRGGRSPVKQQQSGSGGISTIPPMNSSGVATASLGGGGGVASPASTTNTASSAAPAAAAVHNVGIGGVGGWIVGDVVLVDLQLVSTSGAGACIYTLTAFDQNRFLNRDLIEVKVELLDAVTDTLVASLPITPYTDGPESISVIPSSQLRSFVPHAHRGSSPLEEDGSSERDPFTSRQHHQLEDNEALIVYPRDTPTTGNGAAAKAAAAAKKRAVVAGMRASGSAGNGGFGSGAGPPPSIALTHHRSGATGTESNAGFFGGDFGGGDPDIERIGGVGSPTGSRAGGAGATSFPPTSEATSRVGLLCQSFVAFELCRVSTGPQPLRLPKSGGGGGGLLSAALSESGEGPLAATTTSMVSAAPPPAKQQWVLRRVCEGYNVRNPTLVHAVVEGRYVARQRDNERRLSTLSKQITKKRSSRKAGALLLSPPGELVQENPPSAAVALYTDIPLVPATGIIVQSSGGGGGHRRASSVYSDSRSDRDSSSFDTLSETDEEDGLKRVATTTSSSPNATMMATTGGVTGGATTTKSNGGVVVRDGQRSYTRGHTRKSGGRDRYDVYHNATRTEALRGQQQQQQQQQQSALGSPNLTSPSTTATTHGFAQNKYDSRRESLTSGGGGGGKGQDLSISTDDDDGDNGLDALPPILHHHHYTTVDDNHNGRESFSQLTNADDNRGSTLTKFPVAVTLPRSSRLSIYHQQPPPPPSVISAGGIVREPLLATAIRAALPGFDSRSTIRYGSNCYNSGSEEAALVDHFEGHRRQYIRDAAAVANQQKVAGVDAASSKSQPVVAVVRKVGGLRVPVVKGIDLMPATWIKAIDDEKSRKRGVKSSTLQQVGRVASTLGQQSSQLISAAGFASSINPPLSPPTTDVSHNNNTATGSSTPNGAVDGGEDGGDLANRTMSFPKPNLPPEMEALVQLQRQRNPQQEDGGGGVAVSGGGLRASVNNGVKAGNSRSLLLGKGASSSSSISSPPRRTGSSSTATPGVKKTPRRPQMGSIMSAASPRTQPRRAIPSSSVASLLSGRR